MTSPRAASEDMKVKKVLVRMAADKWGEGEGKEASQLGKKETGLEKHVMGKFDGIRRKWGKELDITWVKCDLDEWVTHWEEESESGEGRYLRWLGWIGRDIAR